jgi:hypothetical protein
MGFTFSHPALIIPCKYLPKKFYSLTGLIVGSMIPDLEYFIRLNSASKYSHTLAGIFWFDIPMAFLVSIVYHHLIRDTLFNNLPGFLKSRLVQFKNFNFLNYLKENWPIFLCSVLIGCITHLFWDSFTSRHGYFVKVFPIFQLKVNIYGQEIITYKIIKYVSSIIGGIIILWQVPLLSKTNLHESARNKNYWFMIISLTAGIMLLHILFGINHTKFNALIKKIISSGLFALLITSFYYQYFKRKQKIID